MGCPWLKGDACKLEALSRVTLSNVKQNVVVALGPRHHSILVRGAPVSQATPTLGSLAQAGLALHWLGHEPLEYRADNLRKENKPGLR